MRETVSKNAITESQALYNLIQSILQRAEIASANPGLYFSIISGEFATLLARNQLLEDSRNVVAGIGKQNLLSLIQARQEVLHQFEKTISFFSIYKELVPDLSLILEECNRIKAECPPNSNELVSELELILRFGCDFIALDSSYDHTDVLKKLVTLDINKKIIGYIFAPALLRWYPELDIYKRNQPVQLYLSWFYIIKLDLYHDLKKFPYRINAFLNDNYLSVAEQLKLEAKNFDQVLKEQKTERATALEFDVAECKIHAHRVWEFLSQRLLSNEVNKCDQENSYDGATGKLIVAGIPIKFERFGLRGQILEALFPAGKPSIDPIGFDIIYDLVTKEQQCAIWRDFSGLSWDELDSEQRATVKKDIYDACEGINCDRIEKKTQSKVKNYLHVENLTIIVSR